VVVIWECQIKRGDLHATLTRIGEICARSWGPSEAAEADRDSEPADTRRRTPGRHSDGKLGFQ
jgi:hypothetical protein